MTYVTCRLTAKNRDQLRNRTLGNRVWATFTFFTTNRMAWPVCVSAGVLVTIVNSAQTAEQIEMPIGGGVARAQSHVLVEVRIGITWRIRLNNR